MHSDASANRAVKAAASHSTCYHQREALHYNKQGWDDAKATLGDLLSRLRDHGNDTERRMEAMRPAAPSSEQAKEAEPEMPDSVSDSDFSLDYYEYRHSLDFYRLRWRIREGPIWENIHVLDDPCDPNSAQKPFQEENGNLHEVASRPLSHDEDLTKLIVHYMWAEDEDDATLPRLLFKLPEGQEFFTIGEYVLRVHPWLVEHRDDLLRGLLSVQKKRKSWPASAQLWVDTRQPKFQGIALLNTAADDVDNAWAMAACEAQDARYEQKADRRQQARMLPEEPQASLAFHRLRWEVREGGSIQQRIHVVKNVTDLDSEQVPFQTESGEFHEIADMPATVNPTSRLILYFPALEATMFRFDRWPTDDGGSFDLTPKPDNVASEWSPQLTLVPGSGREFISIKDYVLGAYDWILSMRSRVLDAGHTWIRHEGPEEAWLDPMSVYAIGFFNTKQHTLYEQWRLVAWSAQEMQEAGL